MESHICDNCSSSVALMETACRAQIALSERFHRRNTNGVNGLKTDAFTEQLLMPGHGVNMPGELDSRGAAEEDDADSGELIISEVEGQVDAALLVSSERSTAAHATNTSSDVITAYSDGNVSDPHCQVSHLADGYDPGLHEGDANLSEASKPSAGITNGETVSDTNGWNCSVCSLLFNTPGQLISHIKSSHGNLPSGETIICPFCPKEFPTSSRLYQHISNKHDGGRNGCPGCHSLFRQSSYLIKHQAHCISYHRYQQNLSETKTGLGQNREEQHEKGSEDCLYNCLGCSNGFELLEDLFAHQRDCCLVDEMKDMNDSKCHLRLTCHGCREVRGSYSSLCAHEASCQHVQSLLDEQRKLLRQSGKGVKRESDTMESKGVAGGAMSVHSQPQTQDLKCEGCSAEFDDDEILTAHRERCALLPTSSRGFQCPHCHITVEFKTLLDFHMSIHESVDEYAFHCAGCNAGFELLDHKISHEEKCGKLTFVKNSKSDSAICERASGVSVTSVFLCKTCQAQFEFFYQFEIHQKSCKSEEVTDTQDMESGAQATTSSSSVNIESVPSVLSTTELLETLDYTAPEILCPLCGIDIKSLCGTVSGIKSKASRHFAGHVPSSKHVFTCPGCSWGTSFPGRLLFVKHTYACQRLAEKFPEIPFDENSVNCPVCLIKFPSYNACGKHLQKHLVAGSQFVCEGCMISHDSAEQLEDHHSRCLLFPRAVSARQSAGFGCSICSTSYVHANRGQTHFLELHTVSTGKIWCVFCNTPFTLLNDLILHVNTKCGMAQAIIWENSQKTHGSFHSENGVAVQCSSVITDNNANGLDLSDQESSVSERSQKGGYCCNYCGAMLTSKFKLSRHLIIHKESESRPFHCRQCKAGFTTVGTRNRHEPVCLRRNYSGKLRESSSDCVAISEDEISVPPFESPTPDEPKNIEVQFGKKHGKDVFGCSVCNQDYSGEDQLAKHIISEHSSSQYGCQCCGKIFKHEESLLEHRIYCGKYSKDANVNALGGIQRKTSEDDEDEVLEWKCLSCCVRFSNEMSFLLHVASHEISNVNRCSVCLVSFKSAADICMHMVKYHKDYLVTGVKQGSEDYADDSDKESEDDSDMEMTVNSSNANETPPVKLAMQPVGSSLKSNSRTKSPIGDNEIVGRCKEPSSTKLAADFRHNALMGTQCPVCDRHFSSTEVLRRHYGIHDGYYPAICLECGTGFSKHSKLRIHKNNVHRTPKATDFSCPRCGGAFDQSYRWKMHTEICICTRNDPVIQCLLCVRTFDSWQHLKSHAWTHLTKCSFCEDKISVQSRRIDHMIHCPKNPFNGAKDRHGEVSLTASTDDQLATAPPATQKPKPRVNASGPFRCKQCCSVQLTLAKLRNHEKTHVQAEYRCRLCGGKFNTLLAKNRHIMRDHDASEKCAKTLPAKIEEKPLPLPDNCEIQTFYPCNSCNECFNNKEDKEKHVVEVHAVDAISSIRAFDCKQCDKKFPSKFARRRHMQTTHSNLASKTNSLACPICSKPCGSNFAKMQHMKKVHQVMETPKRKRLCRLCGECFEHKSELKAHRRTQHPQAYVDNCIDLDPNMFHVNNALSSPIAGKVRSCKFCNQLFRDKALLKDHMASEHGTVAAVHQADGMPVATSSHPSTLLVVNGEGGQVSKVRLCKECGQSFASKSELKAHRKAEHSKPAVTLPLTNGDGCIELVNQESQSSKRKLEINFSVSSGDDAKRRKSEDSIVETSLLGNTPDNGKSLPFKCEHCSKSFKLRILLNKHHTKAHPWIP